jgi:hypothetical protein
MPPKTTCPVSRKEFTEHAKAVEITLNGQAMRVPVKEFSTGSLGWYLNNKINMELNGKDVTVQIGLNLTIVGSKDLPRDTPPPAPATSSTSAKAVETTEFEDV